MIIEYKIGYPRQKTSYAVCCGVFRDQQHFDIFMSIEATYGRRVEWFKVL